MNDDIGYLHDKEIWLKDTLTVGQMINLLNKYPKNMKVLCTWESTLNAIKKENIYISVTDKIYIDADGCFYKKEFAKDPMENEE